MRIFLQFKTHGPYPSCEKLKSGACTTPGTPEHPRKPRICQIRVTVSIFHFTYTLLPGFWVTAYSWVFRSVLGCSCVLMLRVLELSKIEAVDWTTTTKNTHLHTRTWPTYPTIVGPQACSVTHSYRSFCFMLSGDVWSLQISRWWVDSGNRGGN